MPSAAPQLPPGYTHVASDRVVQPSQPLVEQRPPHTIVSEIDHLPHHHHRHVAGPSKPRAPRLANGTRGREQPVYAYGLDAARRVTSPDRVQSPRSEGGGDDDDDDDDDDDGDGDEDAGLSGADAQHTFVPEDPHAATLARLRAQQAMIEVMRHGFDEVYSSEEYLAMLSQNYYFYWKGDRYRTKDKEQDAIPFWHQSPKYKTVAAALFLCLRIGFDPPDVVKVDPCSKLEAWTNPWDLPREKALDIIGKKLQEQFESLAPAPSRVKFKTMGDVHIEEFKKTAALLRKHAKNDRALLHYNGHGVPKPTPSGEIWVFNKAYTQYIPVTLNDLLGWLGPPAVFIWDCHNAGNIVTKVEQFAAKRDEDEAAQSAGSGGWDAQASINGGSISDTQQDWGTSSRYGNNSALAQPRPRYSDTIQLAACGPNQLLPDSPTLPADLFTSCLTSPIEIALRFYVLKLDPLKRQLGSTTAFWDSLDHLHQIPGRMDMRRTALGDLNWIFISVTDAIAWNCLPRELFAKIFRADLVVAALFRGFLLADRIMRAYGCTPMSVPALPETHLNPLWKAWDLAVDMCLTQLPGIWAYEAEKRAFDAGQLPRGTPPPKPVLYKHSTFFAEQLTAFETWLDDASKYAPDPDDTSPRGGESHKRDPFPPAPPQLPIVLQVLLSQAHRLRALILLCHFMDMGPWAVHLSLSIGIFQYVLRLLQAPAAELKPVLIYIWARILTVYPEGKNDLFRQNMTRQNTVGEASIEYFVKILHPTSDLLVPNVTDHKAMCAFILSVASRNHNEEQIRNLAINVMPSCLFHLESPALLLRQWNTLLLAHLWDVSDEIKGLAVSNNVHAKLTSLLIDKVPEVRAAALYALGTLIGTSGAPDADERCPTKSLSGANPESTRLSLSRQISTELGVAVACLNVTTDGSTLVRKELVITLSAVVAEHLGHFVAAAYGLAKIEQDRLPSKVSNGIGSSMTSRMKGVAVGPKLVSAERYVAAGIEAGTDPDIIAVHVNCIYIALMDLSLDPFPEVAQNACVVVDYIHSRMLSTPLASQCSNLVQTSMKTYEGSSATVLGTTHVPSVVDTVQPQDGPLQDHSLVSKPSNSHFSQGSIGGISGKSFVNVVRSLATSASHSALNSLGSNPISTPSPPRLHDDRITALTPVTNHAARKSQSPASSITASHNHRKRDLLHSATFDIGPEPSPTETSQTCQEILDRLRSSDGLRRRRRRSYNFNASSGVPTPSSTAPSSPNHQHDDDDVEEQAFFFQDSMSPLPLRSDFYDVSARFFSEPQMREASHDEAGSTNYIQALWRKRRNEKVMDQTQSLKDVAVTHKWDTQIASWNNDLAPNRVIMHQFEDHVVASDDEGFITVYDWNQNKRLNRFSNNSATGTRITTLKLVNEDDVALLLTGSSDGTVRIFRNYQLKNEVQIVTAFRGLPTIEPSTRAEAGLIADWQQGRGCLLIGGNTRDIRVWDALKETCAGQIVTRANSCITSITSDQVAGFLIAAAFGDGSVRIYDRRHHQRDSMIRAYRGHHSAWIPTIHWQRGGQRELLSGDLMGEVCTWDIRLDTPIKKSQSHAEGMPVMAVHEHAPVYASGSTYNVIKIWSMAKENVISKFRNSPSALSGITPKSPAFPMTAIAFHPHRMMLTAGSSDGHLNVFECDRNRPSMVSYG